VRIEGHVADGDSKQILSEQRALAIANWLIKNGVDCKRLLAVGFGDTKPIAANDSPEKATNTRIVFAMAALRGRAIGGMSLDGGGKTAGEVCQ
jgi:OOP family OmpA-OmpF porin